MGLTEIEVYIMAWYEHLLGVLGILACLVYGIPSLLIWVMFLIGNGPERMELYLLLTHNLRQQGVLKRDISMRR